MRVTNEPIIVGKMMRTARVIFNHQKGEKKELLSQSTSSAIAKALRACLVIQLNVIFLQKKKNFHLFREYIFQLSFYFKYIKLF